MTTLYEECILALGKASRITGEELDALNCFFEKLPKKSWGRLDWESGDVLFRGRAHDAKGAVTLSLGENCPCYILWLNSKLDCIKSDTSSLFDAMDDVLAVDFDTFVILSEGYVLEFWHDGVVTFGRFLVKK